VGEFQLLNNDGELVPAMDLLTEGFYHRDEIDDPETCEYFVPVRGLDTVPLNEAVNEVGLFGNQNTVCASKTTKWRHAIERLKSAFPEWDRTSRR
jgi:hypothetical protein|tara:strand:- start:6663 stop:6947 length:285 start_codon:yes stop_codon:yes gene_type:complete